MALDIVGPFPKAKGGKEYLLTYIDMATRWPEAIPIRKATTGIITSKLTDIFSRVGLPGVVVTDNGAQFTSKQFERYCMDHGIKQVRSAPYNPQSNGIVERMHRTLKTMIIKCLDSRGNWAELVPMVLYFMRLTPSSSSGFSPFMLKHGWEPNTPLKLLYKVWVQDELGEVDLEEWVIENAERVQALREQATINYSDVSKLRKEAWDKKAKERSYKEGDKVMYRAPGFDTKLSDSWVGPLEIVQVLGPLTYKVGLSEGRSRVVHVRFLKDYVERVVKRATTILLDDTEEDSVMDANRKVNVEGAVGSGPRQEDIGEWEKEYADIFTEEPGLTDLAMFKIDTGDAKPIHQRAYNTPVSLILGVDLEINWLLEKGYIVPSESEWASPIVTVKKPNGLVRLCVDFKRIKSVTNPVPFYMPMVEEVLEAAGKAMYISKLDLSKGYYQVPMAPEDQCKTA